MAKHLGLYFKVQLISYDALTLMGTYKVDYALKMAVMIQNCVTSVSFKYNF